MRSARLVNFHHIDLLISSGLLRPPGSGSPTSSVAPLVSAIEPGVPNAIEAAEARSSFSGGLAAGLSSRPALHERIPGCT